MPSHDLATNKNKKNKREKYIFVINCATCGCEQAGNKTRYQSQRY